MIQQLDDLFIRSIKCYIDDNFEIHMEYDYFFDALWNLQEKTWISNDILTDLKNEKLETFETFSHMLKMINETFDNPENKCDVNWVIISYMCFIVSNNGEDLYDHYKHTYNKQKLTNDDNEKTFEVDDCPICLETKILKITKCNHSFCNDCLFKIDSCSLCRKQLVDDDDTNNDSDDDFEREMNIVINNNL